MNSIPEIKLYGDSNCHKTQYYQLLLDNSELAYQFLDVKQNEDHAEVLRGLYENRKLNFPTITIGKKKLRNPTKEDLDKWLNKLIPSRLKIVHNKEIKRFILDINGETAKVDYVIKDEKLFLVHSEVPYNLRGQGFGKVLIEKTFEKLTDVGYKAVAICSYIKAVAMRSEKWKLIIEY